MNKLSIKSSINSYDIYFKTGVVSENDNDGLGSFFRDELSISLSRKLVVISDENVFSHYGDTLISSLQTVGYTVYQAIIPSGDQSKSLEVIGRLSHTLSKYHVNRNDMLIALGGGVVGDITGFLASIYMRGIEYIQIPTSLIAQVDSSIGGKTAVNTEFGKNILGSFYSPKTVITDVNCLKTLSDYYLKDGMGEVIKYLLIDESFLDYDRCITILENSLEIVYQCCRSKKRFIEEDEKDVGKRRILNFGHTIGHAIEKSNNYQYAHGECVAMGMYLITLVSEQYGWTIIGTANRIKEYLENINLFDVKLLENYQKWLLYIENDKKNTGAGINIVVLEKLGKPVIKKVVVDDFVQKIQDMLNSKLYE